MTSKKEKNIIIRVSEEILDKYKSLCENNGYAMSKRIRNYIINDIKTLDNERVDNK